MKKTGIQAIVFFALACVLLYTLPILFHYPEIGTVHGVENEFLTIGNSEYERCDLTTDRGRYLGSVTNGREKMRVFKARGETDLLFVLWDWEGSVYKELK